MQKELTMPAIVWKGYISFGLVSFPVRLFSAGRAEAVHFHMVHRKDVSRVKEVWYCAEESKPIVQFVRDTEVDAIYFEHSYYVAPCDDVSKPYALFLKALKETRYSAIAKVSMHSREHVVLIRSAEDQLVLHTLFYPDELHKANKQSVPAKMSSTRKELDLATELIHQLARPFKPDQFHDTYRENVEKLIEQKKKGQEITTEPKPRRAPVIDLMEALKKSLKSSAAPAKATAAKPARRRKVA
jgi:DNA end-binding protein Ku